MIITTCFALLRPPSGFNSKVWQQCFIRLVWLCHDGEISTSVMFGVCYCYGNTGRGGGVSVMCAIWRPTQDSSEQTYLSGTPQDTHITDNLPPDPPHPVWQYGLYRTSVPVHGCTLTFTQGACARKVVELLCISYKQAHRISWFLQDVS